jgi:6,7-dimethyl-8-ribityllumazine synthase
VKKYDISTQKSQSTRRILEAFCSAGFAGSALNVMCSHALEPSDNRKMHTIEGARHGAGFRFAIVVSSYHDFVTGRLEKGAVDTLSGAGVSMDAITVIRVPGAFEIPIAAQHAAKSARYDAIIALGCLIKGETPHMEYIAAAVANGLTAAAAATGVPMAFGVLTTNSVEEALARAGDGANNKGREAAGAALEMASVVAQLTARV